MHERRRSLHWRYSTIRFARTSMKVEMVAHLKRCVAPLPGRRLSRGTERGCWRDGPILKSETGLPKRSWITLPNSEPPNMSPDRHVDLANLKSVRRSVEAS
jgi:hypothetical protein